MIDVRENNIKNGFGLLLNDSDRSVTFICENSNEKSVWIKDIHQQLQDIAEIERSFELQYKETQNKESW